MSGGPAVPPAGAHGGDGARVAAALGLPVEHVLDLSASLNPFAPPVAPVVGRHLGALDRYPDVALAEAALVAVLGVDAERVVLTNGGAEAIALVTAEVGGGVATEPEFALHPRCATGPRWRSDPHNPSGRLAPASARHGVRDEAFYGLATGRWTRGDGDAWVVGSLTKAFACPGLRLGYAISPAGVDAEPVRRRRGPWSVGGLAGAVLPELLAAADLPGWASALAGARDQLAAVLVGCGLEPAPSDAPWLVVRAPGLRDRLARRAVVVRDCASFGLPDHVRIAVPHPADLGRLTAALHEEPTVNAHPLPFDAVVFDVGDTLVCQAAPGTPVADLAPALLPGVARALAALAVHLPLGAVTDTSVMTEADVRPLLARAGIDHLLAAVVTSVDVGAAKPDPRSLLEAARRLGVRADRVLVVGDAEADRGAAAAAGASFARVGGGLSLVAAVRGALAVAVGDVEAARLLVGPADGSAMAEADARQAQLTKPPGSLGRLEGLGRRLSGIAGSCPPPLPEPAALAVFAADHGVVASGVTPWPSEVTAQLVASVATGRAGVSVLARRAGIRVVTVDVGVATPLPASFDRALVRAEQVRAGTDDLAHGPAMSCADAERALAVGARLAAELVATGHRCLLTGEVGIGNTTASAALIAALTGRPAAAVTGHGTGIDDDTLHRKVAVVATAVERLGSPAPGPVAVLAGLGGLEHAALAGFILGGAAAQVPVVLDGVTTLAALLVAHALAPSVVDSVIAGHRSPEPGATAVLDHLGLDPVLDLGLRLGEGTGAALAQPVVAAAAAVLRDMATFAEAGIGAPGRA